jgi:hypothetical protein
MNKSNFSVLVCVAALASLHGTTASAFQSTYISGAKITAVDRDMSTTRGPHGRAYITLDRHFNTVGGCLWSGGVDTPAGWMLEFDAEHPSFNGLFAAALAARLSNATVRIDYDDGFGSAANCRIFGISVSE